MTKLFRRPARLEGRIAIALLVLLATGSLYGCAFGEIRLGDPFDRELTLSEAQHRYTLMVRWSQFQKAKSFVAKDEREAFLASMKALDDVRFTGYESEPIELDKDMDEATVHVTYTIYTASIPYEFEVEEVQQWTRDGLGNAWHVFSTFKGLPKFASN